MTFQQIECRSRNHARQRLIFGGMALS